MVAAFVLASCSSDESKPKPAPERAPPRGESEHGKEMDDAFASVLAMYDAPEGATPCETALNAFEAEAAAAEKLGRPSYFSYVASRDVFLAGCRALTPEAQPCLAPRYQARHRDACGSALPPEGELAHLFVVRDAPAPE